MTLRTDASVKLVPGIGASRAEKLEKLGITTAAELLYHFPRGYQNRGNILSLFEAEDGAVGAFMLTVGTLPKTAMLKNRKYLTKFTAFDDSGSCVITFFNQAYVKDIFRPGAIFRFWGKLSRAGGRAELSAPLFEPYLPGTELPDLVPVYPLTAGISQKQMASFVGAALKAKLLRESDDILPREIRERYDLPDLPEALRMIHCPKDEAEIQKAVRRFAFEQVYIFSLGSGLSRKFVGSHAAYAVRKPDMEPFLSSLDFELTSAQKKAVAEIAADMCRSGEGEGADRSPMSRILTGDVGSGKTVCAAAAVYIAAVNGLQSALMVPTEILAVQHYLDLQPFFAGFGINTALLTGATKKSQRTAILAGLADGRIDFVIGTHALISESVQFSKLGLVITDEQHRFGVMQRTALVEKGGDVSPGDGSAESGASADKAAPHILVMSATPIPRTLALILYGDLAISTLGELPPGRQKIDTFAVNSSYRERLNAFIRKHVDAGHQVYVICPAVEPKDGEVAERTAEDYLSFDLFSPIPGFYDDGGTSGQSKLKNVLETAKEYEQIFPDIPVGYVHGRMKPADKEAAMQSFSEGKTKILVSTTVVEVGVNVPNATLMIIENAERFGLSQLHQLRGRVGRGSAKSYCVLVSDSRGENALQRLDTMKKCSGGYEIAQKDLELRGPGDFFPRTSGTARQHGAFELNMLSRCSDSELVHDASEAAKATLESDPVLALPENSAARKRVDEMFETNVNTVH